MTPEELKDRRDAMLREMNAEYDKLRESLTQRVEQSRQENIKRINAIYEKALKP